MPSAAAAGARPAADAAPADPVEALCREHGYPPELQALLGEVTAVLAPLAPLSVLMHGSAARGELTWWREPDGSVQLGSDLEMYVVVDAPPAPEAWAAADARLRDLEARVNRAGPRLFHLDAGWTTRERFRRHPRTFRCWDTRETGRTLLGKDVRGELPALDAGSIDLRQLNEVPVHRLWEMAFRVPRALVEGRPDAAAERTAAFVCARQALDLTTWLLPHRGVMIPTFRRRVRAWREAVGEPPLADYFSPASAELLEECLEGKLHLRFGRGAAALHADVLEAFRAGLRLLLGTAPDAGDDAIAAEIVRQGRAHWPADPPRRVAWHAWVAARHGGLARPWRALPWLFRQKRPAQLAFLLHLNAALAALLAGGDAGASLARAERRLARLWPAFRPRGGTGAERFLAARRAHVDYLVGSSRWFGPRRAYLYSVVDER